MCTLKHREFHNVQHEVQGGAKIYEKRCVKQELLQFFSRSDC